MPVGPYKLVIEATGFKRWEGTLTVQAGQTLSIDPAMEVGSIANTVEVSGAAAMIETSGAQVSDVKDALTIHDLPLNGRQISNLFDLTPGVVGGANPRTNGMKVGSTEMVLDGMSYVDRFGGGMSRVQPGLDTIQEFRVGDGRVGRTVLPSRHHRVGHAGVAPMRFTERASRPFALTRTGCGRASGRMAARLPSTSATNMAAI